MSCCCLQHRADDDRIIATLARENRALQERVEHLTDGERRRNEWLDQAKREAGFSTNVSFDDVWAMCLKAYRETLPKP